MLRASKHSDFFFQKLLALRLQFTHDSLTGDCVIDGKSSVMGSMALSAATN